MWAATLSLPVYTPASGEAFATYGNIGEDGAIKQPVRRPGDVWPQFGGLDVSLSSTALFDDAYFLAFLLLLSLFEFDNGVFLFLRLDFQPLLNINKNV